MANFDTVGQASSSASETVGPFEVQDVANQLGVLLRGTFVASLQTQISFDGTNFVDHGAALTAPGYTALPSCHSVQFVNAFTSGTVEVQVGGLSAT